MDNKPPPDSFQISDLSPRQIVKELDKYVVGQKAAKRLVAVALRNRWRRQRLSDELREEVLPKNILMIGPTGVGKTEISRRLARLTDAPFLKVEASKYTEVGYVGRDVESMIRDLMELSVNMVKSEQVGQMQKRAGTLAEEHLLDLLLPPPRVKSPPVVFDATHQEAVSPGASDTYQQSREKLRKQLVDGKLNDRAVEIETKEKTMPVGVISNVGMEDLENNLRDMFGNMFPGKTKKRRMKVQEALGFLTQEEAQKLIDMDQVIRDATERVEQAGIVFLDEIDKVAGRERGGGPDVSREGVQRDLLPLIEGSTVNTKYGIIRTHHILFIAAGAFHISKPSDLIPELQGRFPLRVELEPLVKDDFVRILKEPRNALTRQYVALLQTEGITLEFRDDAIDQIAEITVQVNDRTENIGARRLFTIMERLLEDISFDAPQMEEKKIILDAKMVQEKLQDIVKDEDLSRYIL